MDKEKKITIINPFEVVDEKEYKEQKAKWDLIFNLFSNISDALIAELDKSTKDLMNITILDKDGNKIYFNENEEELVDKKDEE